jgi:hypothetical protein
VHFKALDMLLIDGLEVSSVDDQFLQKVLSVIKKNLEKNAFW